MSDFIFVVRCFIFTLLIVIMMQFKVSGISIESRVDRFLRNSEITAYLQDVSAGGIQLAQDGYYFAKNLFLDSTRSLRSKIESQESKASRR